MVLMPRSRQHKVIGVIGDRRSEECIHPPVRIADILPSEPKPERKDTMIYRVTDNDVKRLTDAVAAVLPRHSSQRSMV